DRCLLSRGRACARGLPARRQRGQLRLARARVRADTRPRPGGLRASAPRRSAACGRAGPLHVRRPCDPRRRLAVVVRASRSEQAARLVRRGYPVGSRARAPRLRHRLMGKFLSNRPTLRGFLIIGLIALVVVVLNLYTAVIAIGMLLRIAFFLAITFFIYL